MPQACSQAGVVTCQVVSRNTHGRSEAESGAVSALVETPTERACSIAIQLRVGVLGYGVVRAGMCLVRRSQCLAY
ncbi:unnamed protein product, partial [Iphiclides podalirius]